MHEIIIYTDGACAGNPGPGGWGVRIEGLESTPLEISGGEGETTNNRMELLAAIKALETLDTHAMHNTPCAIYTDSQYVRNGITSWIHNWKRKGWRTANKKPVKNKDLWETLDRAATAHKVTWHWVRGHDGHPGNERADELARQGMAKYL